MKYYNGTSEIDPSRLRGMQLGPYGPNGETVQMHSKTLAKQPPAWWALRGYLPLETDPPAPGYAATGWLAPTLEGDVYRIRPAGQVYSKTLEQAKAEKHTAVQAEKSRAAYAGFLVDEVLFDSDLAAQVAYNNLSLRLASDPTHSTDWKASDGVWVTMDAALFAQVFTAGEAHISACFAWQAAKDVEIEAAETVEAVLAISTTYDN